MKEDYSDARSIVEEAWVIIARDGPDFGPESIHTRYCFIGLLEKRITFDTMVVLTEQMYRSLMDEPSDAHPVEPPRAQIRIKFLNDGSIHEDGVVCTGPSTFDLEALRAFHVELARDKQGKEYIKWRMESPVVNEQGEKELYFWDDFALPTIGISHMASVDEEWFRPQNRA